jgi:hypothetical protein
MQGRSERHKIVRRERTEGEADVDRVLLVRAIV